jgi:hypothetical protein
MATDYAKLTENVLKVSGSPADLYAYALGANAASSPQDWLDSAVNYIKFVDAFLSLVKQIPVIGNTANAVSLTSNLVKARDDIAKLGYVSRAVQVGLLGDVAAVGSALGFVAAAAGATVVGVASTPLLVAAASIAASVGIASTLYSATRGNQDKQLEANIVKAAGDAAAGLGRFSDISWAENEAENLKKVNVFTYPIVELLHILSPSISVAEALKIVDASSTAGNTLQEAAATLNAVRKLITGQAPVTVSTPEQYLAALDATFNATTGTSVAAYTIKPWPASASELVGLAQNNTQIRAAMLLGTPFYITGLQSVPFTAAQLSLYDSATAQGTLTTQWLQDRSAYLGQLSQARINEAQVNPNGYLSVIGGANTAYNTRYQDLASGTKVEIFSSGTTPSALPSRMVIFGTADTDNLYGSDQDDRLYGGAVIRPNINDSSGVVIYSAHIANELYGTAQADVMLGGGAQSQPRCQHTRTRCSPKHYKKRSCLSIIYLGYRAKKHVKTCLATNGVHHV